MPLQVEQQNTAILVEGGRKLEVLRAIKDFKKGIYGLQWEHKRSKLEVRPLRPARKEGCCASHSGISTVQAPGSDRRVVTCICQALRLVAQCALLAICVAQQPVQQQSHMKI